MADGSAELPLCVHFGTKQSNTFAQTSLEKECGFDLISDLIDDLINLIKSMPIDFGYNSRKNNHFDNKKTLDTVCNSWPGWTWALDRGIQQCSLALTVGSRAQESESELELILFFPSSGSTNNILLYSFKHENSM